MDETLGIILKEYLPDKSREFICTKLNISYPTLSRWLLQPISERTGNQLNILAELSGNDELKKKIMRK